jgi:hypothetical protein
MLKAKSVEIYREKRADFIPPLVPETYYGLSEIPDEADTTEKIKNVGRSWMGGLGGKFQGMLLGGAAGGLAGAFNPFRNPALSGAARSWAPLLDILAYGAGGAALGGTLGRLYGARAGATPEPEDPENVYDVRV